ncbi:MAG: hypothetical protein QXD32_06255, partial [Nitrososphaerota archaeon]
GVAILKPLSELIGQSIAIGVAMLFLAIVIDSFQAIVGGQSVMMRYFFSKVGNISHSIQFLSKFTSTVQRMSKVNLLGRMMARRQEDRLLKAAFEQWKHDRKAWENLRERIERMEGLKDRVTFAKQRYMLANRIQDRAFERLAELEGQPGFLKSLERSFLRQVARHHTLSEARIGLYNREFAESLRSNYASYLSAKKQVEKAEDIEMGKIKPEAIRSMAERGADDLIRSLKQRDTARMTPGEFARGAAEMLRSSSPLQRVALADSLVRSDAGRAIFWSYTLEPFGKALEAVGERVSSRLPTGSTLSHIGQQMDGHIRAPAAFSLAAQQPTNPSLPGVQYFGEGVKPTVPAGYVPDPKVGVFSAGRPSAEMPVVRDELLGGSLWDVKAAEEKVERYGAPTDIKGFDSKLPDFMEVFAHQDQAGFKLSDFMDGPGQKKDEPVVFNVERTVDGRPDVRINVEYEVPSSKVEQFTEWLESQKDVVGYSVSRPEVSQEDAQPYSETLHDWVGWPGAKETGQQADSSASQTHSESQYGWSKTQEQANESWSDWFGGESQSGAGVSGASATAEDAGPFDWFSGDRGPERASSGDMRGGRDGGR